MFMTVQCVLLSLVLSVYGCILFKDLKKTLGENDECGGKGDRVWICKKDTDCPGLRNTLKTGKNPRTCSWKDSNTHIICCPPSVSIDKISISVTQRKCLEYKNLACDRRVWNYYGYVWEGVVYEYPTLHPPPGSRFKVQPKPEPELELFFGDRAAEFLQFRSTAIIGYGKAKSINWQCGGSLISERYVLSAAHCSNTTYGPARWARLGHWDLSDKHDGWPQQFEIVERIVHSGYKTPAIYNDIVLFKLDQNAVFDENVRPACLYESLEDPEGTGYATGWVETDDRPFFDDYDSDTDTDNEPDDTEESTSGGRKYVKLVKTDLKFIPTEECKKTIKPVANYLSEGLDRRTMMCAGSQDKDTCQGDSGGPLFLKKDTTCIDTQVGVTSFGSKFCGPGSYIRSSYVRVAPYVPWIESIVWPES